MDGERSASAGEALGLFGQVPGNPSIEPALDLGGEV
jgi:hypothetical protein